MTIRDRQLRPWFVALVLSLLLLAGWEFSGQDLALTRLFGHPDGFPWRHAWLTSTLLHDGARATAALVLLVLAWDAFRPIWPGPTRSARRYWLAVMLACWILIPSYKHASLTSCPWELAEFGGRARYVPHWLPGVADGGSGHCFPSGHATTAFAFIAQYFLWRRHHPRVAKAILAVVLAVGAVLALAQLARGAHHLSHSLWSAWLCAALAVIAEGLAPRSMGGAGPVFSR